METATDPILERLATRGKHPALLISAEQPWRDEDLKDFTQRPTSTALYECDCLLRYLRVAGLELDDSESRLRKLETMGTSVEELEDLIDYIEEYRTYYRNCWRRWISMLLPSQRAQVEDLVAEVRRTWPHPPCKSSILAEGLVLCHPQTHVPILTFPKKNFDISFREGLPSTVTITIEEDSFLVRWLKSFTLHPAVARPHDQDAHTAAPASSASPPSLPDQPDQHDAAQESDNNCSGPAYWNPRGKLWKGPFAAPAVPAEGLEGLPRGRVSAAGGPPQSNSPDSLAVPSVRPGKDDLTTPLLGSD